MSQQNLVGKVIFATPVRAQLVALTPYIVIEQSSFALTVVEARGGVHALYLQTLQLNGPSRHEIVAYYDDFDNIEAVIKTVQQVLESDELTLTDSAHDCGNQTLERLNDLRTTLLDRDTYRPADESAFFDPDLGEDFDEDEDDDSEDEARAAGEAAAEAMAERDLDNAIENLLGSLLPTQTIVIRCQTPEEVESALSLLFGGQAGN